MSDQGSPCWFEYHAKTGQLEKAQQFYESLFGWKTDSAGMEGFDYRLFGDAKGMIAGLAEAQDHDRPMWLSYFVSDDADKTARLVAQNGGSVEQEPADIPGTGRFAVFQDPEGVTFGILQPLPMPEGEDFTPAFAEGSPGRVTWVELAADRTEEEFDFYAKLFPWKKTSAMALPGDKGNYQMFAQGGRDIGGMMAQGEVPVARWIPYFWVDSLGAAIDRLTANQGQVVYGPGDVPGDAQIAICLDPWMAGFGLVGPKPPA